MPGDTAVKPLAERPLMVMRVSRDGGRTYGPARVVNASQNLAPLLTSEWPLCRCKLCGGSR
ncbi:hypothetical protein CG740_00730 [Streptomyces sp. CB01201]|nr:hypothetical protein CG740_00730 [Streptomyces sp. CB01201]